MQIDWHLLDLILLAQDGAVPAPPGAGGTPPPGAAGTLAPDPGSGTGTQTGQGPGGFSSSFIYLMLLMVGAMLVFSIMGQRRDRKKRQALLSAVKKHDRVQTVGGVIGSIVELKSDTVVLKVDESSNTRITFARSAIQQVLTSSPEGAAPAGKVE